jgi:hypothetical protein
MPLDREVQWRSKGKRPSKEDVGAIVEGYFNGMAEVEWREDRYYCRIAGLICHPLNRVEGFLRMPEPEEGFDERYIEVWPDKKCLYVMTRQQDEATNALAEGLIELFVRAYEGKRIS